MDTNSTKPTKKAGSVSTSPKTSATSSTKTTRATSSTKSTATQSTTTRLSAEEKLKKSIKNLSYTGTTTTATTKEPEKTTASNKSSARKKVGGVVLDVETIQDATKQKFETRGRRNNVVILILSLLLVVSVVYLIIAVVGFMKGKEDPNCKYFIAGDAQAEWIVEGGSDTQFTLREGLGPDTVYLLNSQLKIKSTENVMISIEVKVLLNGEEILITGLYFSNPDSDLNEKFTRVEGTNKFIYQDTVPGGTTIHLFDGIDFTEAPSRLNSANITMEITANVNKIS